MKRLFRIDESEKNRILGMHKSASSRQYLKEQESKSTTQVTEQVVTNFDSVWDYKKEGENYFAKKKTSDSWIKLSGNNLETVKSKVFNDSSPQRTQTVTNKDVSSNTTTTTSTLTKSPFTTKKHGIEYREWLNTTLPNTAKKYDVDSPSKLSEKFKNTEAFYNNKNILNSLNQMVTWGSGAKKGQKISVWEYYQFKNRDWDKKTYKEKIETGDFSIPDSIPNADRLNKELYFINARPQYNDKPFFIVDPRLNLVLAFDKQHKLVDYSQSIASADKQQDVIFTRKDWCELSSKTKNPEKYGYGERTYEKINGVDTCVRTHNGKKYVSDEKAAASDETLYQGKTYAYDVLGAENKRYAQKGIYGIGSKFYQSGYEGQEGIPNAFLLKKDGVDVGTAIHALVPTGNRLVADKELKGLLQKDLNSGTIPQEYIDMVEKDFLSPKSKYDLSSGCFNVDPEFIQNPKVQEISNYPDVPVFIMGEQDTDYLVQVEPGKEGEFMLDLTGKEGKCVSPSSLEDQYGFQVDGFA